MDASSPVASPSATSTGIAAYLTTVANQPSLRHERIWKRFVRVRTDDLESVRVERAIKRVRSDLAAHVGMSKEDAASVTLSENESAHEQGQGVDASNAITDTNGMTKVRAETPVDGTDHDIDDVKPAEPVEQTNSVNGILDKSKAGISVDTDAANQGKEDATPSTPVASDSPVSRIHRSQSADPDKSSRLSRVYATSSSPTQDTSSSKMGDESSSVSTIEKKRAKKKRSVSTAPREPRKSQRKVNIDDFEMMRVLGKGCAGKVLLVKQKTSSELYALKAITKRHVLAHQELQHTLTEQAVLKRMAAEGRDPFVVKLWWSFHDKENLFLVMVRVAFSFLS